MDLQGAVDNFGRAMTHCDNIIAVHQTHGGGGRGRRIQEVSLDRAVIVLAVAAWQAAVQDLTKAILDESEPVGVPAIEVARYRASVGFVTRGIDDFATPNAEKTRSLMIAAGFDPYPHWTYVIAGGQGRPRTTWQPHMVTKRLNEWVRVRHAVAHGHDKLPIVDALKAVRDGNTTDPAVRLADAQQCVSFTDRLVRLTAHAIAAHLGTPVHTPR